MSSISEKWQGCKEPFLVHSSGNITFSDIQNRAVNDLSEIKPGQVVALIGDFDPVSILTLFKLIERRAIILPLTVASLYDHEYFFEVGLVDFVIQNGSVSRRVHDKKHEFIATLRERGSPGLIAFSTGTTGRPKAILHDFNLFLKRFETKRPALRTINFLMFDHIGGLNTLFHTLFNGGIAIIPNDRSIDSVLTACNKYSAEVLPTTPTFLRMMLMSGLVPDQIPSSLKIITYGSERMDQQTLDRLCELLPHIEFRQTYGTSELGVVRVKSEARNSLFIKIGDLGLETKVLNKILYLKSKNRMLGYLNADSPFDSDGWYNTRDIVEEKNNFFKIVGRDNDLINVGGFKFMVSEVELKAINYPNVFQVKVYAKSNPITGQHVELTVEPQDYENFSIIDYKKYLRKSLPIQMMPQKILLSKVEVGKGFKKK